MKFLPSWSPVPIGQTITFLIEKLPNTPIVKYYSFPHPQVTFPWFNLKVF